MSGDHRSRRAAHGQARAQLVTEFIRIRRLKLATLGVLAATAVAAVLLVPHLDDVTRDPGFAALDELVLPAWAATDPRDAATGSRWCVQRCRVRERVWSSRWGVAATAGAFRTALAAENWHRLDTRRCPGDTEPGRYRCFRRDAFALDLWVRPAACADANRSCPGSTVVATVRPFTRAV